MKLIMLTRVVTVQSTPIIVQQLNENDLVKQCTMILSNIQITSSYSLVIKYCQINIT